MKVRVQVLTYIPWVLVEKNVEMLRIPERGDAITIAGREFTTIDHIGFALDTDDCVATAMCDAVQDNALEQLLAVGFVVVEVKNPRAVEVGEAPCR
jgi:hypothetical protein